MGRTVLGKKKRDRKVRDEENGFGDWGGYMAAKKAKLLDQFHTAEVEKVSDIFEGVAIHVNGLTKPPADELKNLMAAHGGEFHMYQVSRTTHIIASNLPNVKIKHLGTVPIVKPSWIIESISLNKLLDYRRYLLYTNQSTTQPRLDFPILEKPLASKAENVEASNSEEIGVAKDVQENLANVACALPGAKRSVNQSILEQNNRAPTKTASDPNFLEEFYNNSRLHLISTLGAEFKQLVGQMRDKSDGKFPGKDHLVLTKGKNTHSILTNSVVMHIDMDCFFVSVGLRNHPELRGKPVAITHARNGQISNRPDRKINRELEFALYSERLPEGTLSRIDAIDANASMSEIASCSYEARKCGIKNGMFLGQAVKLCPELKTLPYDFEGYREVSNTLYKTIASYTLDIEAVSCDEMYVDVTNILRETGLSVDEWASHIRNEIMTATGCPCSTGFGANRLQARLATRRAKPAGQYYLQADDVEMYMAEIPLADLPGVGRATLAKLRNLGLNTCGDVQVASLKVIQSEIGQKAGETLKDQSKGLDRKPLNFHHERKSVSAEVNYGIRFKTLEECHNFLQSLSNEVYNRLNDIGMRARCLTLKLLVRAADAPLETAKFLGHGVCDSLTKSTTSNVIINDPEIIYRETKSLYDKLNPVFTDLRGIGIQLSKLEKNVPRNTALSNFLKQAPMNKADTTKVENKCMTTIDVNDIQRPNDSGVKNKGKEIVDGVSPHLDHLSTIVTSKQDAVNSKRGRPKGIKKSNGNRMSKNPANMSLNKYFGKNKSTQQVQKSQQDQTNVKLDPEVLKELPEELRNEIIQEYNCQKLSSQQQQENKKGEEIDLSVLNELPEELRNEVIKQYKLEHKIKESANSFGPKSEKNKAQCSKMEDGTQRSSKNAKDHINIKTNPFSKLPWDKIKPIIKQWIKSAYEPSQVDTEMLATHLRQLAVDREIEILRSAFNFLHRVFSELNCLWHRAYFTIVNITQEGMVARYGGTLVVKRKFVCCHM